MLIDRLFQLPAKPLCVSFVSRIRRNGNRKRSIIRRSALLKLLHGGRDRGIHRTMPELSDIQLRKQRLPFFVFGLYIQNIVEHVNGILNTGIGVERHGAVWRGVGCAADAQKQRRSSGEGENGTPPARLDTLMQFNDLTELVTRVPDFDDASVITQHRGVSVTKIHNHCLHDATPSFTNFRYSAICG